MAEPDPSAGGGSDGGDDEDNKSNRPFYGLLLALVIAVVGWLIIDKVMSTSKLQDCVMSGRKNCAPIDDGR